MTRPIPYTSITVAYLWRGNWYTVDQMTAIQADTRNLRTAHDAQCNALPYTAAMQARREERLQDMTNRKELEPLTDCKPLTVAIIGSRDYADLQAVADYVNALPDNAVVVSGGARGELHSPFMLCGTMFGLKVWRHRFFETNIPHNWLVWPCNHHKRPVVVNNSSVQKIATKAEAEAGMDISWMNRNELSHAIPPAYTAWIGRQLIAHLDQQQGIKETALSLVGMAS